MERGLLWLPLLVVFFWFAWVGWNEYHKLQSYTVWAEDFDHAKYDIFAVIGEKAGAITWGKPTRKGPVNLQTFLLTEVRSLALIIDGEAVNLDLIPPKGKNIFLQFQLTNGEIVKIPFTQIDIAGNWAKFLEKKINV